MLRCKGLINNIAIMSSYSAEREGEGKERHKMNLENTTKYSPAHPAPAASTLSPCFTHMSYEPHHEKTRL